MKVKKSLIKAYKGSDISDGDRLDLLKMAVREASNLVEPNHGCVLSVYLCDEVKMSIETGDKIHEAYIGVWGNDLDLKFNFYRSIPVEDAVDLFVYLCKLYHSMNADIDAAIDRVVSNTHRAAECAIANTAGALK